MKIENLIFKLAHAIARQEGFFSQGTRAQRNNNPGNIWDGIGKGKKVRIWPNLPIDDAGFLIFKSPEQGTAFLYSLIMRKVAGGMNLTQLIASYAPSSENDTNKYLMNVKAWTELPDDIPLWHFLAI